MKIPKSLLLAATAAIGSMAVLVLVRADGGAPTTQSAADDPLALVGKAAPDFSLKGLDGKMHSPVEAKGHVLVLDFWATWCVPCRVEQKHLMEIYKELGPQGLMVFAIDTNDDPAKVAKFVSDNGVTLPVLLDSQDGAVGNAYKVNQMPETVVIGKDGVVASVFTEFSESQTPQQIQKAIADAMGKP